MDDLDEPRARIREAVRPVLGKAAERATIEPAFAVLASPGWHGVDGVHWRVRSDAKALHVKVMHADAARYVDIACALRAAEHAAAAEVGPAVLATDPDSGISVMADLSATHRCGTLDRIDPLPVQDAIIAARKAFQAGPRLGRTTDAFSEVARFAAAARAERAPLPADIAWLEASVAEAGRAVAACGRDLVPAQGDGNASNVLIGEDGSVRLVDWDRAGDMDPFEDLATFMGEVAIQEPEARDLFVRWHGGWDPGLFARAMLYVAADDLRWGLIAALLAATSPRTSLEFLKYANWRFLRCRMQVRDPRFSERVRSVR